MPLLESPADFPLPRHRPQGASAVLTRLFCLSPKAGPELFSTAGLRQNRCQAAVVTTIFPIEPPSLRLPPSRRRDRGRDLPPKAAGLFCSDSELPVASTAPSLLGLGPALGRDSKPPVSRHQCSDSTSEPSSRRPPLPLLSRGGFAPSQPPRAGVESTQVAVPTEPPSRLRRRESLPTLAIAFRLLRLFAVSPHPEPPNPPPAATRLEPPSRAAVLEPSRGFHLRRRTLLDRRSRPHSAPAGYAFLGTYAPPQRADSTRVRPPPVASLTAMPVRSTSGSGCSRFTSRRLRSRPASCARPAHGPVTTDGRSRTPAVFPPRAGRLPLSRLRPGAQPDHAPRPVAYVLLPVEGVEERSKQAERNRGLTGKKNAASLWLWVGPLLHRALLRPYR